MEGQTEPYDIINILPEVRCLDEDASEIMWWTETDERPEKVGEYRMITDMVIDSERAGMAPLFRLAGWQIAIICSEAFRSALAGERYSGLVFEELKSSAAERSLTKG